MTPPSTARTRSPKPTGTDAARLAFFERLAEAELHLLLATEPEGDAIAPHVVEIDGARYALAFDLPERLTDFAGARRTATLSGRRLAAMLASEGLGLGLNLEDAPSAQLLDPAAMAWLDRTLAHAPEEAEGRIEEITPPGHLPEALLTALDAKLGLAAGLASTAYLAGVRYHEGGAVASSRLRGCGAGRRAGPRARRLGGAGLLRARCRQPRRDLPARGAAARREPRAARAADRPAGSSSRPGRRATRMRCPACADPGSAAPAVHRRQRDALRLQRRAHRPGDGNRLRPVAVQADRIAGRRAPACRSSRRSRPPSRSAPSAPLPRPGRGPSRRACPASPGSRRRCSRGRRRSRPPRPPPARAPPPPAPCPRAPAGSPPGRPATPPS